MHPDRRWSNVCFWRKADIGLTKAEWLLLTQSGHWPWIAKHAAESVPVHDTDHGTGWGTRLVPSSSRSIVITSACVAVK
jgi:hypothetical protein